MPAWGVPALVGRRGSSPHPTLLRLTPPLWLLCLCTDPDGLPSLADKQKSRLQGWVRPDDICDDPKMIKMVSSMAIKQVGVAGKGTEG